MSSRRRGREQPPATLSYNGSSRGSHQRRQFGQNFDFSGFIRLVKDVYKIMEAHDSRVPMNLPFCMFQHAMTEILTARMLFLGEHRFDAANCYENYNIPLPIFLYIEGIGRTMEPGGAQIDWNLPKAAIPQKRIEGEMPCRSGTFGIPVAANHNAYECYISPYITSEYVKRQAKVTEETENLNWNPFPPGWLLADCEINENLLGYHKLQKLHIEGLQKCSWCDFTDDDTIDGLLCHSEQAMFMTSRIVFMSSVKSVRAHFTHTENLAAFVFKETRMAQNLMAVLWKGSAEMYSPCAMSAGNVNKSSYFGYKRKRNSSAPGVFALCNGQLMDGWLETINDNFECTGLFGLRPGLHDKDLRSADHDCGDSRITDLDNWLMNYIR